MESEGQYRHQRCASGRTCLTRVAHALLALTLTLKSSLSRIYTPSHLPAPHDNPYFLQALPLVRTRAPERQRSYLEPVRPHCSLPIGSFLGPDIDNRNTRAPQPL
jgi:hypothetical protein